MGSLNVTRYLEERPSKQFLIGIAGFAAGVAVHSLTPESIGRGQNVLLVTAAIAVGITVILRRRLDIRLPALCAAALLAGFLRFDAFVSHSSPEDISRKNGEQVRVDGMVSAPPQLRETHQRMILAVETANGAPARGRLLLRAPPEPRYRYGDRLSISCAVEAPRMTSGFDEQPALLPERIFSVCNRAESLTRFGSGGNSAAAAIYGLKDLLTSRVNRALPEPEAALAAGLLFGDRRLPADIAERFRTTGTSHILAVSGYNVAIITVLFFTLLGMAGIPRRAALAATIVFLLAFVVATGATASVVRAALMGALPILGQAIGRPTRSLNALAIAGSAMLAQDPALLFFDIGFALSFLATAGLLFIAPAIGDAFGWGKRSGFHLVDSLRGSALQTFAAIAVTFPVILAAFGRISLVAPVANLFMLFAIPWTMLAVFAAGVFGLMPLLGPLVTFPATVLLDYLLGIAALLSGLPWSDVWIGRIPPATALLLYPAAALPFLWLRRKQRPPAIVDSGGVKWTITDSDTASSS